MFLLCLRVQPSMHSPPCFTETGLVLESLECTDTMGVTLISPDISRSGLGKEALDLGEYGLSPLSVKLCPILDLILFITDENFFLTWENPDQPLQGVCIILYFIQRKIFVLRLRNNS